MSEELKGPWQVSVAGVKGVGLGDHMVVLKGPILIAWEAFAEFLKKKYKTTYVLIYEHYKHRNCFIHSCTQDLAQRRHLAGIKEMLLKITSPYGDENRQEKGALSREPHNTIPGLQDEKTEPLKGSD